jgi:translation initiation factor 1
MMYMKKFSSERPLHTNTDLKRYLGVLHEEHMSGLKELKQQLGCGGAIEEEALVVQGDHRERVRGWLEKRGVKRVSVG